jgi:hypothetical protein
MLGPLWGHVEPMFGQEWRVHLSPLARAQMNTLFLGHVGAMLGLLWVYFMLVRTYGFYLTIFYFANSGTKQ